VASAALWPLSMPGTLRHVVWWLNHGKLPSYHVRVHEDPFRGIDDALLGEILTDLAEWRETRPERFGNPAVSVALMNVLAQEGRKMLQDWSTKDRRLALVDGFGNVLDSYDKAEESLRKAGLRSDP